MNFSLKKLVVIATLAVATTLASFAGAAAAKSDTSCASSYGTCAYYPANVSLGAKFSIEVCYTNHSSSDVSDVVVSILATGSSKDLNRVRAGGTDCATFKLTAPTVPFDLEWAASTTVNGEPQPPVMIGINVG